MVLFVTCDIFWLLGDLSRVSVILSDRKKAVSMSYHVILKHSHLNGSWYQYGVAGQLKSNHLTRVVNFQFSMGGILPWPKSKQKLPPTPRHPRPPPEKGIWTPKTYLKKNSGGIWMSRVVLLTCSYPINFWANDRPRPRPVGLVVGKVGKPLKNPSEIH